MKVPRVVKAMEYIDDDLINGAITYAPKKKKPVWIKWGAMAACLCLVVISVFSFMQSSNDSKSKAPTVLVNNAEYTICGTVGEAAILKDCGLPTELSSDLAGKFIAYLDYDGECYYNITDNETDTVMFEYKPEPNTNVYIVLIEDIYYAAIRRDGEGFHGVNGNSYNPGT